MNAVNAVQLLILVWTYGVTIEHTGSVELLDICVRCADVTGTVGEEVNLTCSVSLECSNSSLIVIKYKFQYPKNYKNSEICKEDFNAFSEQRDRFTCRFTPTTAMTGQFRFFVQTTSGRKISEFTVNITERTEDPVTEGPVIKARTDEEVAVPVIAAVASCFFIILVIIITLTILYKTKPNCRPQWILGHRHDEDNRNYPVNVI